jgi:MSHA biogenesis protein MshK
MDEAVSARLLSGLFLGLCLCLCAAALPARAQALADPTRPPANLYTPAGDSAPVASAAPQLQSVLIARHPGGRHVAVIDGQTVRLGGTFKGARVERMTETEVVLVDGRQRRVLRLFPPAPSPQRHNDKD